MTNVNYGPNGAKRRHPRRGGNPRETLLALLEKHPHLGPLALKEMCRDATAADQDQLDAIFEYWYANNHRSLTFQQEKQATPPEVKRQNRAQRKQKVREIVTEVKQAITKMVLLDMTMANGKRLRDCTGRDCYKFQGWLTSIGHAIKPNQKVGAVLSESQVQAFFARA